MKTIILPFLAVMLSFSAAHAKRNTTVLSFACLNLDGIPIAHGTDAATKCCAGGVMVDPPPAECKIGFNSVLPTAVGEGMTAFQIAQNTLQNQGILSGGGADLGSTSGSGGSTSGGGAENFGILAGGQGGPIGPMGTRRAVSAGGSMGGARGAGAEGGFGGAMGAGGVGAASMALSGATGPNQKGAAGNGNGVGDGNSPMGAYASRGTNDRMAPGYVGPGQVVSGDGPVEVGEYGASGSGSSDGAMAGAPGAEEELLTGSAEDAADYLNRIDRNLSIFSVISKRYEREISRARVRAVEIK